MFCKFLSSSEKEVNGPSLRPLTNYFVHRAKQSCRVITWKDLVAVSIAVSGDGKCVYLGSLNGYVRVHGARTGRPVIKLTGHTGGVFSIVVATKCNADNTELVVSGGKDCTVRCWRMPSGKCIQVLTVPDSASRVAVSKDGNRFLLLPRLVRCMYGTGWKRAHGCFRRSLIT